LSEGTFGLLRDCGEREERGDEELNAVPSVFLGVFWKIYLVGCVKI
jgi:hypothetical protein